jgi:hypothetical protein
MLEFFGFGVGTIELRLDRFAFCPGDTIRGQLVLALREPQSARALVVGVRARQKVVDRYRGARENVLSYRNETVWEFKHELAGEGVYTEGTYPFELVVPSDVFHAEVGPPPGLLGDVARAVSFLQPQKRFPLQWHVFGSVRRRFKLDLTKKVDIVVTERQEPAGR